MARVVLLGTADLDGAGDGPTWTERPGRAAAVLLAVAARLFIARGGTHVVRGVLDEVGALPRREGAVDDQELNRGRPIGELER